MTLKTRSTILLITSFIFLIGMMALLKRPDPSLRFIQQNEVIKIGYAVEAPYAFIESGGEVTGAEIELAKVVVARLGIPRIEWRLYEFGQLIPALEDGQIDAIVAGMFITPERAERVSFSEPTFHVQQGLLVAAGNPHQLYSYAQIATLPDIKVAVISGAIEETLLNQLGVIESQLVIVPDALTGRVAVETDAVDGLALSALTIRWMTLQDQLGRTEMAQPFEWADLIEKKYQGYGAVVFRQGDDQLRFAWNAALKEILGTSEHLSLISSFGFTPAELPGTVTTKEILSQP